jgi:amino acid adenylation domain-containing protein
MSNNTVRVSVDPFPASALEKSICDRFQSMAGRFGNRLAIRAGDRSLTYAQLAVAANRIATAVATANPSPGPIAVLLNHGAQFPAAILGALATGRPCVALDADHPMDRNQRIATHAGAACVICTRELASQARALFPSNVLVIDIESIGEPEAGPAAAPPGPDDVAHIIYTSGSTGSPKGVFQNHRGVLHDIMQAVNTDQVTCEDQFALFYAPTVIAGLRTMLTALLSGAALHVIAPTRLGRSAMVREIAEHGITILRSSPTLLRHIVAGLEPNERFNCVRLVALGGERVDWGDFDIVRRSFPPSTKLSVHLGATECWTLHTTWYVEASARQTHHRLPVGRAIPDRRARILNADGSATPDGEVGEIVVTSRYIALGYWRDPGLTAQSFETDSSDPLGRRYRTGDLVRRLPDGLIEFVGRQDQQVKLHGYRIEPNEVEVALKACTGVSDGAVVVRCNESGLPVALIGYAQLKAGQRGLLPRHLLAMLSQRLAPYMLPAEIVLVDELPWLPNFKIDRKRLAQIDAARHVEPDAVNSVLVVELIQMIEKLTKVSGATASDNLLTMGGDSLQALELVREIEQRFRVVIHAQVPISTRSIADWAEDIGSQRDQASLAGAD